MTIAAALFFMLIGALLGSAFWLWFYRGRLDTLHRQVDQLTRFEAFEAARPRELVRVRHVQANGVAWNGGAHKLEHVDELVRSWATLQLEPFELAPGETLQGELLIDELEVRPLFVVRAKQTLRV